ncbi:hypothetical protein GYB22_01770 [bacterium]|nr:hypothetical protein [bacterium]
MIRFIGLLIFAVYLNFGFAQTISLDSFESLYQPTKAKQILLFGEIHDLEFNEEFYDVFIEKLGKENGIDAVFIEQSPSYYLQYRDHFYFDFHLWEGAKLFPIDMEHNIPNALKWITSHIKAFELYDIKKYRELKWILDSLDAFSKFKKEQEIKRIIDFTKINKDELIRLDPQIYCSLSSLSKTYEVFGKFRMNRLQTVTSDSYYVKREQVILHNYRTVLGLFDSINALAVMGACHVFQSQNSSCTFLLPKSFATELKLDEDVKITSVQVSFNVDSNFTSKASIVKLDAEYLMELDSCLNIAGSVSELEITDRYHIYHINSDCTQYLIISNTLYREPEDN